MNQFDWDKGFRMDFNSADGFSKTAESTKRHLSQMQGMYMDSAAAEEAVKNGDPVIYEFYELGCPERKGDLAFGTSIVYPGKIGDEYYMTKGHFHCILDTAEVYYTFAGEGMMMLENPEGDTMERPLKKGEALYVPRRYAHRSVNTGDKPLVMFFTFGADSGHDYGTIESKGFRKVMVDCGGKPAVKDNPKWK